MCALIGGKQELVRDVGKCCAFASRGFGARVLVLECHPICAFLSCTEGFQTVTMRSLSSSPQPVCFNVVTLDHTTQMKNNTIAGHIGHFDVAGLEVPQGEISTTPCLKWIGLSSPMATV